MKAAVFRGPGRPLEVTEVPTPTPRDAELLVRVAACGICHTDLHYLDHGVKPFKPPPLVLGHEISGTVAALGRQADGFAEGDHVLVPAVLSCGRCPQCRAGRENLCDRLIMLGNHIDGGYAEYVAVPAKDVVRLPSSLPLGPAALIADALSTPYHAVTRRARVRPGHSVAVVGCGGVGLNVVQCAALAGGQVIAIDLDDARLVLARRLGASATVNPRAVARLDAHVRALTGGGVDVAFEAIGTAGSIRDAYGLLRRGGRLCVIGYSHEEVSLSAARLMFHELEIVGSLGCGAGEYPEIVALVEAGRLVLDPIFSGCVTLDDVNEGLDRLRRGEGVRWVVTP